MDDELRKFNNKERSHLDTLQRRLDYLKSQQAREDYSENAASFIAGEANALAWALALLTEYGKVTVTAVRLERMEHSIRSLFSRVGRLEEYEDA